MTDEDLELLITVVVAADDEQQARTACGDFVRRVGGRIAQASDCSDEEPGCWSVGITVPSAEKVTHSVAAALARAVRAFVRDLGDAFPTPHVACEPPTAWTVLDDPDLLGTLVPGTERLLVEAWAGADPYGRDAVSPPAGVPAAEKLAEPAVRLFLRVDVATDHSAGAEWQARAVASRVARSGTITRVVPIGPLLSVHIDLGLSTGSPAGALLGAVASLGLPGWSDITWNGDTATIRWAATPPPHSGITALEVTVTHRNPSTL